MQVKFNETSIANETFQRLKIDVQGTQLEAGKLKGCISASFVDDVVFLSAAVNRTTLFFGNRLPGMTPLAFLAGPDPECYFHGDYTAGAELCGFNLHKTDTNLHWRHEMCVIYVPTLRLMHYLHNVKAEQALERMDRINQLPVSADNRACLERLYRHGLNGDLKTAEQVYGRMAMILEEPVAEEPLPMDHSKNLELHNFIRSAHENVNGAPLSIPQIFKALGLDVRREKTLRCKCKAAYGLGLAALTKRVRLEQARISIKRDHLNVASAMQRHNFIDRKQFNADYLKVYGIRPDQDRVAEHLLFDL